VGKISIRIKTCNSWVYAADVFVMLELKTKLLSEKAPIFCRFAANRGLGTGYAEERDRRD